MEEAQKAGIKVVAFDSVPPEGMVFTSIGNDFCSQAQIASERLVELLHGKGTVAIMQGVPTAPNHKIRYECHKQVFAKYPGIKLAAEGIDNDDIETAQKQAAAVMQANPDLGGWVACDAAGPIGIGQAIKEAGKTGKVIEVGLDNLKDMVKLVTDGVADSSSSTRPQIQGFYAIMMLYDGANGIVTPKPRRHRHPPDHQGSSGRRPPLMAPGATAPSRVVAPPPVSGSVDGERSSG